ncbi:MAG: response regulator [Bacteroidota bacterium]
MNAYLRRFLFFTVLLGVSLRLLSQDDSTFVESQIRAAGELRFTAIDSALLVARKAKAGAEQLGNGRVLAKAAYQLSVVFTDLGEADSALVYGQEALQHMRAIDWAFGEILSLNTIGAIYRTQGNYRQALDYLQESYFKAEEIDDSVSMAYALNNLGNVYFDAKEDEEAEEYYGRGLKIARLVWEEDPYILSNLLTNMSNVAREEDRYNLLLEGEAVARKIGDSSTLVFVWNNLAGYHETVHAKSDSVQYYYSKSFQAAQAVGDLPSTVAAANGLAEWHLDLGQTGAAKSWIDWALAYGPDFGSLTAQVETRYNAARWFRIRGRPQLALLQQDTLTALLEEAYEAEKTEALANAYQRYEVAEKDLELAQKDLDISKERARRTRLTGGILGLLAITATLLLWFRARARYQSELQSRETRYWQELHNFKTRLFADVSHDLRHPLSLIVAPVRQLQEQILDQPTQAQLELISNSADSLLARVNSLLDLARLEAGQLPLRVRPVELLPFLQRTILTYESMAEGLAITIKFQYELADDLLVEIDADKVEKVLQNLMSNALKYSAPGSSVQFTARQEGDDLHLAVSDNGPGIPPEQKEQVFERFGARDEYRAQSIGIGLALSRQLAQRMDGDLSLLTTSPQGATFQLSLPYIKAEAEKLLTTSPSEVSEIVVLPHDLPQGHVLLVEDQEDMRRYLEQLLQTDYKVLSATNGVEALQLLQTRSVDLILSDIGMPGMDGINFREKVKENEKWAQLPFVFLTARALEEQQLAGLTLGVDDYLLKPFIPSELLVRLQNLYRNTLKRQQNQEALPTEESANEAQFRALHRIALSSIHNSNFNVRAWSEMAGLSARQLRRTIQQHSNLNAVQYLLELRLQQAYKLIIRRTHFTVAEVAYECGIDSLSYFSRKFQERFGIKASELLRVRT